MLSKKTENANPCAVSFKEALEQLDNYIWMLQKHYELTDSEIIKIMSNLLRLRKAFHN